MNQPLFYLPNVGRKQEYRLETRIWQDGSGLKAEKRAFSPAANDHLLSMVNKYELLTKHRSFCKLLNIVRIERQADTVVFKFVNGPNAERVLIGHILESRHQAAIDVLERIVDIVDTLPKKKVDPTANELYKPVFGDSYSGLHDCIDIGIVDLNLDNIIVDEDDKWYLIDYEWVFEFPIPRHYLIQRILWWFMLRHQEAFRYHAQSTGMVEVAEDIVMPKFIYDKYSDVFANIKKFVKAEDAFQLYVSGEGAKRRSDMAFYENPEIITFPHLGLERLKRLELRIQELRAEHKNLSRTYQRTKTELSSVKASRAYSLYRRFKRLENYAKKPFK